MHFKTLSIGFLYVTVSNAQSVGIGITAPQGRLHVADSAVLFTEPFTLNLSTQFASPVSSVGTRLMWYPQKGALRAGNIDNAHWDKDNAGLNSIQKNRER